MVESIDTYGGFYIGRYETGNLVATAGTEPVVVKGNKSISNINWYYMYRNIKELAANNSVKSTMIWGCLWDRTLIWLAETNQASSGRNGKSYAEIVNSSGWGNYTTDAGGTGNIQPTGNGEVWKSNNIYDMAGNVQDWTIEVQKTSYRVMRGGYYYDEGSSAQASFRNTTYPSDNYNSCGSRTVIYIMP